MLDQRDIDESSTQTAMLTKAQTEERINGIQERLSELEALEKKVKREGPVYKSDPDSKMMRTNNNGVIYATVSRLLWMISTILLLR